MTKPSAFIIDDILDNEEKKREYEEETRKSNLVNRECPNCGSFRIFLDLRSCARTTACQEKDCQDCHDYKGTGSRTLKFLCLVCQHRWSVLMKRPIKV